jgi:rod shape-determining protein MreC
VRPGDLVVTSGLCGIFPKGLPIGKVLRVEKDSVGIFQSVEVVPSVDLNKLEEISILFLRGD